jgi:two-component system sensor histidine kinase RegB
MAIALAVAGAFVTYAVHRIGRAMAEQTRRIEELSHETQENRFAIALGALSAGAAHELGSPLGTVQLLAEELPHLTREEQGEATKTIRQEVQRMKRIVHGMDSSQLSAQVLGDGQRWAWAELRGVLDKKEVQFRGEPTHTTTQPREVIAQILRELVRNAERVATPQGIFVTLGSSAEEVRVSVEDDGPGLSSEEVLTARKPFVSETGGTGLGLFLATVHARQLGGRLDLKTASLGGIEASLVLPRELPFRYIAAREPHD